MVPERCSASRDLAQWFGHEYAVSGQDARAPVIESLRLRDASRWSECTPLPPLDALESSIARSGFARFRLAPNRTLRHSPAASPGATPMHHAHDQELHTDSLADRLPFPVVTPGRPRPYLPALRQSPLRRPARPMEPQVRSWNHETHESHEMGRRCGEFPLHPAGECFRCRENSIAAFVFVSFVSFVVHLHCGF